MSLSYTVCVDTKYNFGPCKREPPLPQKPRLTLLPAPNPWILVLRSEEGRKDQEYCAISGEYQHQIAKVTSDTSLLLLSWLFLSYSHTHKTCVIPHRQNIGRQAHQKKSSRLLWDWYHRVCFSLKCVPPPFPPSWENSDNKLAFFYVRA